MAGTIKNEVLVRVYVVLFVILVPFAGLLMYRTVEIAVLDREANLEEGLQFFKTRKIQAERGNIYSNDGNLLATSIPYFSVFFDPFEAKDRELPAFKKFLNIQFDVHVKVRACGCGFAVFESE